MIHGSYRGFTRCCPCPECQGYYRVRQRENREAKARTLPLDDVRHGTNEAYADYHCRCEKCRSGHKVFKYYDKLLPLTIEDKRHGTRAGYRQHRCPCGPCVEAERKAHEHSKREKR